MMPARKTQARKMENAHEKRETPSTRLRILLADDSIEILNHVSEMLEPEYEVVCKTVDGNLVSTKVKSHRPDLAILDISLGEHSGIKIARELREQGYGGEIIFLTTHEDSDFVNAAIGAGGRGYIFKSRVGEDLKLAVKTVLSHQLFVSKSLK